MQARQTRGGTRQRGADLAAENNLGRGARSSNITSNNFYRSSQVDVGESRRGRRCSS